MCTYSSLLVLGTNLTPQPTATFPFFERRGLFTDGKFESVRECGRTVPVAQRMKFACGVGRAVAAVQDARVVVEALGLRFGPGSCDVYDERRSSPLGS